MSMAVIQIEKIRNHFFRHSQTVLRLSTIFSATDIKRSPSICVSPFHLYVSTESRFTLWVSTSAGFYFLPTCGLWPTDGWSSAHGFLSISGSFPLSAHIKLIRPDLGIYWALVSSEGNGSKDIRICLCERVSMPLWVWGCISVFD